MTTPLFRPDTNLAFSEVKGSAAIALGKSPHIDENTQKRPSIIVQFPCSSIRQSWAIAWQIRETEAMLKWQHKAGMYSGDGECRCGRSPSSKAREKSMSIGG